MKRVLLLAPGAYGAIGGIGLYCRDLAQAMSEMPDVSEVVVLPRDIQLPPESLPRKVRFETAAAGRKSRFVGAALKEVRRARFDLIVCAHINLLPLAVALKAITGTPMVLVVYGIDVWEQISRWSRTLTTRCEAVWTISIVTMDRMNAWAQLPVSRYVVLPNAIHLDRYGMQGSAERLRERYGLAGRKIMLTLARLPGFDRYKGVDEMLECLPALSKAIPEIHYVVAGDGDDRPRLEAKARELGVAELVTFTGYVAEEEKADYYKLADAFVLPGRGEGFGFVFLEALASGVPVVGSVIDGSKDALRDGLLGELVDPRDLNAVTDATLRALQKPKQIPEGLSYFAWPMFCERLETAMKSVQTGRHGATVAAHVSQNASR